MTRTITALDWTKKETPTTTPAYVLQEDDVYKITLEDDSGYILLESSRKWTKRTISSLNWN